MEIKKILEVKCSKADCMECCKGCLHAKPHEWKFPKVGAWNNSSECDFVCGNDAVGYDKCKEIKNG